MKDSHFTVLGFSAANGEPVMCAVIFSAKSSLCEEWVIGFNASAPWIGANDNVDANTGAIDKDFQWDLYAPSMVLKCLLCVAVWRMGALQHTSMSRC